LRDLDPRETGAGVSLAVAGFGGREGDAAAGLDTWAGDQVAAMLVPHFEQKFAAGLLAYWQDGQIGASTDEAEPN
jgi:hypothetical protein